MTTSRLTRRDLLSRIGWASAAVPLLNARARAASAPAFPRRLVLFTVPSCGPRDLFWPTGGETDFKLSDMTSPLEDLRTKLLFVGGLASLSAHEAPNFAVHEAHCHLLTGAEMVRVPGANGPYNAPGAASVDWVLANTVPDLKSRPFGQLVIGFNYEANGYTRAAPKGPGQPAPEVTRREGPAQLFDQIFGGRDLPGGGVDPALQRLRDERASVLDYLGKSVESYASRLGTEDRQKIAFHLDAIRSLEKRLTAPAPAAGCAPGRKPDPATFGNVNDVPKLVQQQLDVVAAALACDLTRVVTLQWAHDGGNRWNYPWLGPEFNEAVPKQLDPAGTGIVSQHFLQHQSWTAPRLTTMRSRLEGWWVQQFAYLAHKLDAVREGSGTMLDNTALVLIGAQGLPSNHAMYPHPVIIAGSCGGAFNTGRFLRLGTRTDLGEPEVTNRFTRDGYVAHNRLLVSLANAMGLDAPTFGIARYGGTLAELRG